MPKMQLPKKLQPILTAKQRNIVLIGGRGSGKTIGAGDKCLMDCQTQGIQTACFREFQNSIDDSVHSMLVGEIARLGLQGFDCQEKQILYKGERAFRYRGMARNIEGIKGMSNYQRFWIEEAQTSSQRSIDTIKNTLRAEGSQIYWTGNPKSAADPFSQRFIVPYQKKLRRDGYYCDGNDLVIVCNYSDNPFFPDVLEQERLRDKEHMTDAQYRHIWEGEFYDEVDNAIIPVKWFDACIDAHIRLKIDVVGPLIVAHDPSDEGPDDKGLALRQGMVIRDVQASDTGDINEGLEWALDYTLSNNANHFTWDGDGMGVALKRDVERHLKGRNVTHAMFRGGGGVDNPDMVYEPVSTDRQPMKNKHTFRNKRSQRYWDLRDRFCKTYEAIERGKYTNPDELISISSDIGDIDQLRAELCRIPLKHNPNGMIQVMSKQDMARLPEPIASPNLGDSVMMSLEPPPMVDMSLQDYRRDVSVFE